MECNKEEATRAMSIAEKKLTEKDYNGAKKFVSKAQSLYPNLDGLRQVLTMIDVFVSASNQNNNESDLYGILGVDPLADDVTVKKHYKKLALLLHPDKNKFLGAKEAFELVLDAWCLLSDHSKRKSYDQQRKYKEEQQKRDADANQEEEKIKRWFDELREAERRFKNGMRRENENSTAEAERLFKRRVFTTGNANSTSEAERLFRKPMKAEDANSTSEAERLFGWRPWRCVN
ncbi:unnamed protein product [Eruca vesicaria subsp. sativa]|uniref:J domain-containing protein n=1 Tax=Eruca vesicaria subsp. sativa TaxID=29727 RepID=A0ABC8J9N4_ERUVS|nr:unnamed protein product [Eruca vesicaria subsp. sativa]